MRGTGVYSSSPLPGSNGVFNALNFGQLFEVHFNQGAGYGHTGAIHRTAAQLCSGVTGVGRRIPQCTRVGRNEEESQNHDELRPGWGVAEEGLDAGVGCQTLVLPAEAQLIRVGVHVWVGWWMGAAWVGGLMGGCGCGEENPLQV